MIPWTAPRFAFVVAALLACAGSRAPAGEPPFADAGPLTLELVMSDPAWIARSPSRPYWSDDGRRIYYEIEREGSELSDTFEHAIDGSPVLVTDERLATIDADPADGDHDSDRSHRTYARHGDLFVKDLATGEERQLTRTDAREFWPFFLVGDDRIAFGRDGGIFVRDLTTGLEFQPYAVEGGEDPEADEDEDEDDQTYVAERQARLFGVLGEREREAREQRERDRERRRTDPTWTPRPFHLGKGRTVHSEWLSPSGRASLVVFDEGAAEPGRRDTMPEWITDDGYVETRPVRGLVGTTRDVAQGVVLLDLDTHEPHEIDLGALPGIREDPLAPIKAAAEARRRAAEARTEDAGDTASTEPADTRDVASADEGVPVTPSPSSAPAAADPTAADDGRPVPSPTSVDAPAPAAPRAVSISSARWSDDGSALLFFARSRDNKDRWLCHVDAGTRALTVVERLHDPAWINWRYNDAGWLPDGTLWFLSEASGWSHLYVARVHGGAAEVRALTHGRFEVDDVIPAHDGTRVFVSANVDHPGSNELYAVDVASGAMTRLTELGGRNAFVVSPDERRVVARHDTSTRPPELYLQSLEPGAPPRRLTETITPRYAALEVEAPLVVAVPSRHADAPIWSRLHLPPDGAPPPAADGRRPAVLFVHGAGYLQNAHLGWSTYFREFLFHVLLARRGYVVLDMDYRGSAGYGRDWRTAIYRHMGEPELLDYVDGIDWLVEHHGVDPERVGIYGGSYGGFLALMALFKQPDRFAAGAALRPVTDWSHYNHGYTANILNTPDVDPEAYERSSPIEFAEGLSDPLLICHGMLDDNVFFKDTVRLAQRLIELGKQDWEVAMYPVEPHAFEQPSSWLDEYRRILALFERALAPR